MRTNIEIDDRLMAEAMEACGLATKRAVEALLNAHPFAGQPRTAGSAGDGQVDW